MFRADSCEASHVHLRPPACYGDRIGGIEGRRCSISGRVRVIGAALLIGALFLALAACGHRPVPVADPVVTPPALLALGIDALEQVGVGFAGAEVDNAAAYAPLLLERRGVMVALLAFGDLTPVTPKYQPIWPASTEPAR